MRSNPGEGLAPHVGCYRFVRRKAWLGVDALKNLADLGITDVLLWPWLYYPGDMNDLNHQIDCIRRFRDDIYPLFE